MDPEGVLGRFDYLHEQSDRAATILNDFNTFVLLSIEEIVIQISKLPENRDGFQKRPK